MKKIIIILVLLISTSVAIANTTLDKIENSLFGYTYSNESEQVRLERIEENVYGKKSSGQIQSRIAKLNKDLSVDSMGQEIAPKEDTFAMEDENWVYSKEPMQSSKMDYPVIDELEKQVFHKEFKEQNIKTRLANLENKALGKTYENDELAIRVDRLKAELKPRSFMANTMDKQENYFYDSPVDKLDEDYHLTSYGDEPDYDFYNRQLSQNSSDSVFKPVKTLNLSTIEKTLYKTKFENEPTSKRLSRIESSVFGTTFPNDSDSERISRISSAINAQKTAKKYDSNRFNQNMATAFQIGTLILMVLACIL